MGPHPCLAPTRVPAQPCRPPQAIPQQNKPLCFCALACLSLFCTHLLCDCLLRWLPPQLEEFDRQSQAKLSGMSASDVSLLLEAFRTYGYAPSEAWLQEFAGG